MIPKRSQQKELIDLGPEYYSLNEYLDCLRKLFNVNRLFGAFSRTVKLLKRFDHQSTLVDIGCGGGLFLLHLSKFFPKMKLMGMDINSTAISEANKTLAQWKKNKKHRDSQVSFQLQQKPELHLPINSVDILLATLVCHHLEDNELIEFLKQAYLISKKAVIINDLHRSRLSYWLYAIFSPILFRNRLITHDGLISIQRGFIRSEWKSLLEKANIQHYQIKWCFPFYWLIILSK